MSVQRSSVPGGTAALIVLPSLISGVGVAFVLVAILVNQRIVQDVFLVAGVVLLWLDFFITAAIWRYSVRSIDQRLSHIEAAIELDREERRPALRRAPNDEDSADTRQHGGEG